ncbi:MAG: hypothetical protein EXR21_03055 [Flavobacteriaceae bacterium]|nr:hypothetical protein [Flavobacteriaceae bacterium]
MSDSKTGKKSPLVTLPEFSFGITEVLVKAWLPFVLFMFCVGMVYIANAHYSNKVVVNTAKLNVRLKELRSEYISIKKELMQAGRQSELFKQLQGIGLKPLTEPPIKIYIGK